jgi:hypothetical protein
MKKVVALVVVLVCCVTITGCPDKKATTTDAKKDQADKGKGAKGLTVNTNKDSYTVKQGEQVDVEVTVNREGFDDDVTITFDKLPKGVTAPPPADTVLKKGTTKADYNLKAADDAPEVDNHGIIVEAKGGGKEATHAIKLTVKKKG